VPKKNGSPTNEFYFERDLLQGDPLSRFLFLIAAEGMNAMTNLSLQANLVSGFPVGFWGYSSLVC
jgi:hypothetical protein